MRACFINPWQTEADSDALVDPVATAVLTFAFDTSTLPAPAVLAPTTSRVAVHSDETRQAALTIGSNATPPT